MPETGKTNNVVTRFFSPPPPIGSEPVGVSLPSYFRCLCSQSLCREPSGTSTSCSEGPASIHTHTHTRTNSRQMLGRNRNEGKIRLRGSYFGGDAANIQAGAAQRGVLLHTNCLSRHKVLILMHVLMLTHTHTNIDNNSAGVRGSIPGPRPSYVGLSCSPRACVGFRPHSQKCTEG